MAVVLEKLMNGEVTAGDVVDWLLQSIVEKSRTAEDTNSPLSSLDGVRSSFIQYFINHLRTQTMELTFHGQTVFASPAGKANKLFKALREQSKPVTKTPRGGSSHRTKVNLFKSPATSDFSDISALEGSFSSFDMSGSFTDKGSDRKNTRNNISNRSISSSDCEARLSRSFDQPSRHNTTNPKSGRKGKKSRSFVVKKATPDRSDQSQHNVSTPDPKCNFSLDSINDFPSIGSSASLPMTPRRITPTAVSTPLTSRHSSFGEKQSSFGEKCLSQWPNLSPTKSARPSNMAKTPMLEAERSLLRRLKSGSDGILQFGEGFSPHSPGEKSKNVSFCDVDQVVPELCKVTSSHHLEVAIDLYSRLLEELLVPNVWMELYFLIQLLTVRGTITDSDSFHDDDHQYLSTVHNAVYFAVEVLDKQQRYFALLDKATLKLLMDNDVIQRFKPSFQQQLVVYWENSTFSLSVSVKHSSMLSAVPFHVETDNRENFPSDRSFHSFKKQRDKFYELLREWQVHHTKPGWSMHTSMASRIRDLISIAGDTTNFYHLAKLFTSQLIRMCQEDPHQSTDAPESLLLNHLKMENPDKLKRLEERFTTPSTVVGPCPPPQFKGCQEFFRSFIIEADSYTLNQHLMDCISTQIKELNKFSFLAEHGAVTSQLMPDKEQKDQFISCFQTLQILAKFLGLIKFLPYKQSNGKLTEKVREEIMAGRQKVQHQLDVVLCLQAGYRNRRLILVVPWLVEYFSMMDADATALDYYSTAIKQLGYVYRIVGSSDVTEYPLGNQFLLLLLIGWLFEVQSLTPDLLSLTSMDLDGAAITEPPLDHIPLVDRSFLYSCCPYLSDIKGLLSEAAVTSPMRKITPVAADVITQPTNQKPEFLTSQVQVDLERNFFHTQSQSLKKTVDFVASRVASNCIKYIDAVLLLNKRKALASQMMALFQDTSSSEEGDTGQFKKAAQEATDQACKATIAEAEKSAKVFIEKKCKVIIRHILTEDASAQLLNTVCSVVVRNSIQKVQKWISVQIPGAFKQELESTLQKCLKLYTAKGRPAEEKLAVVRDPETNCPTAPSSLLQELKDAVLDLLNNPNRVVRAEDLHTLVRKTRMVLLGRQDLTQTTLSSIEYLVKDLFTLTCLVSPKTITGPNKGPVTSLDKPSKAATSSAAKSSMNESPPSKVESPMEVRETRTGGSSDDNSSESISAEVSRCPHFQTADGAMLNKCKDGHIKTEDEMLSVSENNNLPCTNGLKCCTVGCPFEVSRHEASVQGNRCLLHEFTGVLQEQLGCRLTPGIFFCGRSEVIAGFRHTNNPGSEFHRIYSYMSEVDMIHEEVT